MEGNKKSSLWCEAGYELFGKEGLDGIQIERLARILQLNKSGFYHYFADMQGFCQELIKLHQSKVDCLLHETMESKKLDPDYLLLLVKHKSTIMFQVQLTRNKDQHFFYEAGEDADRRINLGVRHLWLDYLGSHINPELAMRYYDFVRDMFYIRVSFRNFSFQFLHDLIAEAKFLIDQANTQVSSKVAKSSADN